VAGRREVGEVEVADVAVRLCVCRVEEGRVAGTRSVARHVDASARRHLLAAVRSSLVAAVAAPCCHSACGRGCGSDCARADEAEGCGCGCGWQWDFDSCSDSDCDCGCCCDCCDHSARQPYRPGLESLGQADSQQPRHRRWADGTDGAGRRMEPRGSHAAADTRREAADGTALRTWEAEVDGQGAEEAVRSWTAEAGHVVGPSSGRG